MSLATNLRQGIDGVIEVMLGKYVRNMPCATHVKRLLMFNLEIICATYNFVIYIAPTEEIRVFVLELQSNFYKKMLRIMTCANLIRYFLTFGMNLYCVGK